MSTPGPDADGSTSPDRPSYMWKADRRIGGLPVHVLSPSCQTAADIRRELEVKEAGGWIWMGQYENEDWNGVACMSDPDVRQRLLAALDEGRLAVAAGEDSLRLRLSMGHAGEVMAAHYGSAAMRFRGLLHAWDGVWRLRDPAEVAPPAPQSLGKRRGEGA